MPRIVLFLLLLCLISLAVQAADYRIGEGDLLEVSVWGVKDLNFSVRVRPDGKITVPGLGDAVAAGYTPEELQKSLSERLKELVKNPIVTVMVREITNSKVYIFGGGVKSGIYDLNRKTTLLQLLCSLGETKSADLRRAYLLRDGKRVKEDFHRLFAEGKTDEDVQLENGDSLFIPLLVDRNVYVLGAVATPRSIEYREGMTVMEAILEAGGFTKFASQNDTFIRRREGTVERSIAVRARDIIRNGTLSSNVRLQPGDYVIVPESLF